MIDIYFAILWCFLGLVLLVSAVEADAAERKAILFLGNSLTAGYGLDRDQAFPALIQEKIDSLGWNFEVINAGQGGDTTAGGLRRLDWLLSRKVHVLVLDEADGVDAPGDDHFHSVGYDLLRGHRHAHETRGALAIDTLAGHRDG